MAPPGVGGPGRVGAVLIGQFAIILMTLSWVVLVVLVGVLAAGTIWLLKTGAP